MKNYQTNTDNGKNMWTKFPVVFLAAFICCFLWGSAAPSIKIGYRLFQVPAGDTPSRILFAGIRFTLAGLMVIAFTSARERKFVHPTLASLKYVMALAATQTILQYIFYYMSLAHTTGVRGSVINAAGTFFSIFLAVFIFHFEKLNARKVIGSVLGFAGVVLMVTGGSLQGLAGMVSLQGEGAMIAAALASATAGCLLKAFSKYADPVMLSGWQFFFGGLVMTLVGAITGGNLTVTSPWCCTLIIYMGFISAGAYSLWGILLKYNPVSIISILGFMNPVLAVLLSALFLGESGEAFSPATFGALILISAGIVIVNVKTAAKANQ